MTERPPAASGGELGEIPYVRAHPGAALFARRAARFESLAEGHPLGDFLRFCARLSGAQGAAFAALPASEPGADWTWALRTIASELEDAPMPVAACGALERLVFLGGEELAALAAAVRAREFAGLDLAEVPFAAAALQVEFAARAARTPIGEVARAVAGCPVCASPPVAGVVLGDDRLRYLECGLCGSSWNLTRVKCSYCGSTEGISYLGFDGDPGEVKAETCERCRRYVKLFYLEWRPAAEPAADDLATLALDVLVAEQGYVRNGVNLFLPA